MSRKDDLVAQLREMAGTPSEMAAAVEVEASDATFRRAIKELVDQGVLVAVGEGRARRYSNTAIAEDREAAIDAALLSALPCTAREFSDVGHNLGLWGDVLAERKLALNIETVKHEDGRWHCRQATQPLSRNGNGRSPRQARMCPKCQRRNFGDPKWTCPEHGVGETQPDRFYFGVRPIARPRPTGEQFAMMAAKAGEGGRTIGARPKQS